MRLQRAAGPLEVRYGKEDTMSPEAQISQPPSRWQLLTDVAFRRLCVVFSWLSVLLVAFIVLRIAFAAAPAAAQYGFGFLTGTTWDANKGQYAILPEIWGTLYSSLLALFLGRRSAWRRRFS